QRVEARHLGARARLGEARQLEHHPGAGIQLLHVDVQVVALGGHLVGGAGAHVGLTLGGERLAVAAQDHRRARGRRRAPDAAATPGPGGAVAPRRRHPPGAIWTSPCGAAGPPRGGPPAPPGPAPGPPARGAPPPGPPALGAPPGPPAPGPPPRPPPKPPKPTG